MVGKAVVIVFLEAFREKQPAQTRYRAIVNGELKSSLGEKQMLNSHNGRGAIRECKVGNTETDTFPLLSKIIYSDLILLFFYFIIKESLAIFLLPRQPLLLIWTLRTFFPFPKIYLLLIHS